MSAADKLAQVLAEHDLGNTSRERYCTCGAFLGDWAGLQEVSAHQAAVVLAHLAAEGWAQGNPEYAVSGAIMHPVLSYDHGAATTLHTKHGMPVVRRYVTDWEPVEGEQK